MTQEDTKKAVNSFCEVCDKKNTVICNEYCKLKREFISVLNYKE